MVNGYSLVDGGLIVVSDVVSDMISGWNHWWKHWLMVVNDGWKAITRLSGAIWLLVARMYHLLL